MPLAVSTATATEKNEVDAMDREDLARAEDDSMPGGRRAGTGEGENKSHGSSTGVGSGDSSSSSSSSNGGGGSGGGSGGWWFGSYSGGQLYAGRPALGVVKPTDGRDEERRIQREQQEQEK